MLEAADLELLDAIASTGSLAAVAHRTAVTPAAVTQRLARLEAKVGAPLVDRGPRGARLTDLGRLIAEQAAEVSALVSRAQARAETYLGQRSRRLRVGALASAVRPLVADALANVRLRHPVVEPSVVEIGSQEAILGVRRDEFDVAIVAEYAEPLAADSVQLHRLMRDRLMVAVPDDHRLARGDAPISLGGLAGEDWVSGAPGRRHRTQLDELAKVAGFVPRVAYQSESYEVALSLVAAGMGVALIPRTACHPTRGVHVRRVRGAPSRTLFAVTAPSAAQAPMVAPMLAALKDLARA
ncbi:DNA-binding transcriptional LysR family regulator [Branchiibius hedensis]|uniref:DNA-binding transcriptional regulator, LysR family n=1 Tax=Branchiibius hedensis TaxID=672460 RepID=A0A2Y8ZSJ6_9MICO|nr:LysR family transcriptional regulator [Branchiibius hedensis]PWJ26529.1 DNA-binding transcriptional LysR family regulator [Branchiibius hedensis]SSA35341.1 DNA-binding transcriptional regulator, LysR family [Branchiibius hedensis]